MDITHHVTQIVTAYISRNKVAANKLPEVIASVHDALCRLLPDAAVHPRNPSRTSAPGEPARPAVPVRASVQPNYLVCLEDGKKMKSLKRHLLAAHGMSLEQYADRWGLPRDYPMVAPNYSVLRSQLAKNSGLGKDNARRGRRPGRT